MHILKGDLPAVTPGRILGHEGVGVVDQVGANVGSFKVGDRVLISCITSCGKCANCKKGMYSHCQNEGGWILGNLIDGTQAEYVRIPHADNSLSHNITLTTRLVDTVTIAMLLKTIISGKVRPRQLITHRFALGETMKAYDTFRNATRERALKVLILND